MLSMSENETDHGAKLTGTDTATRLPENTIGEGTSPAVVVADEENAPPWLKPSKPPTVTTRCSDLIGGESDGREQTNAP